MTNTNITTQTTQTTQSKYSFPTVDKGGRPKTLQSVEEFQSKTLEYFQKGCTSKEFVIKVGKTFEKHKVKVPTITGLALYLGFASRQSFYDYEKNPQYSYSIKRARSFIEKEYEEMLQINPTGAIFALKNFGWSDKLEIDSTINVLLDPKQLYKKTQNVFTDDADIVEPQTE